MLNKLPSLSLVSILSLTSTISHARLVELEAHWSQFTLELFGAPSYYQAIQVSPGTFTFDFDGASVSNATLSVSPATINLPEFATIYQHGARVDQLNDVTYQQLIRPNGDSTSHTVHSWGEATMTSDLGSDLLNLYESQQATSCTGPAPVCNAISDPNDIDSVELTLIPNGSPNHVGTLEFFEYRNNVSSYSLKYELYGEIEVPIPASLPLFASTLSLLLARRKLAKE